MVHTGVATKESVLPGNGSPRRGSDQACGTVTRAATGSACDDAQDLAARIEALSESLHNSLPLGLIPYKLAEALRHHSNHRLQLAREQGIKLEHLYIGTDCLPTWSTLYWDPENESLHNTIQMHLLHLQLAQKLGEFLQQQIRDKSNRRLRQALALGIKLENIFIGECDSLETVVGPIADLSDPGAWQPSDSEGPVSFRDLAPSNIYDSDEDDEQHHPDEIYMNNHVDTQPIYDEYGNSNIVHDVEIVGGHGQHDTVDLGVYMAVDDEEVQDLPEVELAMDRKSFEQHFGDDDAVDVHIPDMEIFCFDKIEEYDDDDMHEDNNKQQDTLRVEPPRYMELDDDGSHGEDDDISQGNAMDICGSDDSLSDSEMLSEEE
ncbi:hypothetical protein MAC_01962 [Metarhizium acridum CQMa 102]|uniref:Uncharacterized protein n=1 Tax=Metarhizium acridum (strain CQMa 102) TaxID=655827 RepID=E9DWG4_METAQ|nr:uncharacterized protein MAC_01962 [Metarhizium acridum CQMa 102]EFY92014.1 hypothetical protein MAC_01962 [Metarhizium acridum CQMa 102]